MKEIFNEKDWLEFREKNPELRFFQALREYLGVNYICMGDELGQLQDTFYITDDK